MRKRPGGVSRVPRCNATASAPMDGGKDGVISQEIGITLNPQRGFGVVLSLVWDGWMGW